MAQAFARASYAAVFPRPCESDITQHAFVKNKWRARKLWAAGTVAAVWLALSVPAVHAQQAPAPDQDVRKLLQNPFAGVINVPISYNVNFDTGPFDRNSNNLQIEPLLPFGIPGGWLVVPRILINAEVYQPDVTQNTGGVTGFGDTTATFFFSRQRVGIFDWGIGPTLVIPSATDSALGQGKWCLGPSAAAIFQPKWGTIGLLFQNVWSVAGDQKRSRVNQMALTPSFQYNLPHNWFLTTQPEIDADWTVPSAERWLVPVGGGFGKVFNVGKQNMNAGVVFYRNVVTPPATARWQMSLQFSLIFPEKKSKHG